MDLKQRQVGASRLGGKSKASEKIVLAAGSVSALYLLPGSAVAGLVTVTNQPVSLTFGVPDKTVTWDVDSAHGGDFNLSRQRFTYTTFYTGFLTTVNRIRLGNATNGRGVVGGSNFGIMPLQASFNVGPTLANAAWNNSSHTLLRTGGTAPVIGFPTDQSLIGFRFMSGADTLYGWATIDINFASKTVTIENWTYNTTPNAQVHVGETVPEPSSLALLALGAGGLAAWRKRKESRAGA